MGCTKIMTIEEMQDHTKWLEMRRTGIGGSDAAVVVGMNPYRSVFSLWMDKTGQSPLEEERSADAEEKMMWGRRFEDDIADEFSKRTGKKLQRCGMLRHNEHPFMLADVDRIVVGENAIVEIKTAASWMKERWDGDEVPDAYFVQCVHYLAVGGWDKCYLVCLLGGQKMVVKEIERNEEEIDALIEAERNFWENHVVTKTIPTVDSSEACTQMIREKFQGGSWDIPELDNEYDTLCTEIMNAEEQIKQLQALVEEKKNKIKLAVGDAELAHTPTYNVYWRSGYKTAWFDSKQFKQDRPDLYEYYRREKPFRKFYIKVSKARTGGQE